MAQVLTQDFCTKATSGDKQKRLFADARQRSLYLRVMDTGAKTFELRTRHGKAWKVKKLGVWPRMSPEQARHKCSAELGSTIGAAGAKNAAKLTFREVALEHYAARIEGQFREPLQQRAYIDRDMMDINSKRIDKVTRNEVKAMVAKKVKSTSRGVAGNRLLAIVKGVFEFAVEMEYLAADPVASLNRGNTGVKEKPREVVIDDDDEIRHLWALPKPHGTLYRFLLASGQRLSEVLALATDLTQIRGDTWVITENKSGRVHRVPVTPMMRELLAEGLPVKKRCAAWNYWDVHRISEATIHDIRRTTATRMDMLGVASATIEALLNHKRPKLEAVYQRGDMQPRMRAALELWQAELRRIVATV